MSFWLEAAVVLLVLSAMAQTGECGAGNKNG